MGQKSHGTYFMPQQLHDIVDGEEVRAYPFNSLSREGWLTIFHHMWAHEIEFGKNGMRPRGSLVGDFNENTAQFALYLTAQEYLRENHGCDLNECYMILVPESELDFYYRAEGIVDVIHSNYEWKDVSRDPDDVVWDLQRKKAA